MGLIDHLATNCNCYVYINIVSNKGASPSGFAPLIK